jgi:PmbA protein
MRSTGHAGGTHNVLVHAENSGTLEVLLETLGTGLLVTELMGQGINMVTGDYSRGAAGFWIEGGKVQKPVAGVTIAGNLLDMFAGIAAIGDDVDRRTNIQTGSILIRKMTLAGD